MINISSVDIVACMFLGFVLGWIIAAIIVLIAPEEHEDG
jgi:hypothetical protein